MIHIARGDDQHALLLLRDDIANDHAERAEHLEVARADGDGHKLEAGRERPAGRATAPPGRVRSDAPPRLRKAAASAVFRLGCQLFVDVRIAQRRMPCAFAHDRQRLAHAGVIRAENDVAAAADQGGDRRLRRRVPSTCSRREERRSRWREFSASARRSAQSYEGLDLGAQVLGVAGIEAAGEQQVARDPRRLRCHALLPSPPMCGIR